MNIGIKWLSWTEKGWEVFDPLFSEKLESAFQEGCPTLRHGDFIFYIPEMIQYHIPSVNRRAIKRTGNTGANRAVKWNYTDSSGREVQFAPDVVDILEVIREKHGAGMVCFHEHDPWVVNTKLMIRISQSGQTQRVERSETVIPTDALDDLGIKGAAGSGDCKICFEDIRKEDEIASIQMINCHNHSFHRSCIERCIVGKSLKCPVCAVLYGQPPEGNQPNGTMKVTVDPRPVKGHEGFSTIVIRYSFPRSIQGSKHPTPGAEIPADERICYLPNTVEGQEILGLLQRAWRQRLLFTVGISLTHGRQAGERIIW